MHKRLVNNLDEKNANFSVDAGILLTACHLASSPGEEPETAVKLAKKVTS
jgi:hypothetical protein